MGTVPWRIVAGRAWSIVTANCSHKDIEDLERHLELRLKPLGRSAAAQSRYKPRPIVPGQLGTLRG